MKYSLISAFLLFVSVSFSQITHEKRIEFDLKNDERIDRIVPIGAKGFVTLGLENVKGANDIFHISKYSTNLEKENSVDFERESRIATHATFVSADSTQIIFLFSNRKEWILKTYDIEAQSLHEKSFEKADAGYQPLNYEILDGRIVMNGYQKRKPTVLLLDLTNGDQQFVLIPGISPKRMVESFGLDNTNEKIVIFMRDGKDMKKSTMHLLFLESNGTISTSMELDKDPNFSIIDGIVTWENEKTFLITGTYGTGRGNYAAGYYFSKWTDERQEFITYHSFTEFETYLNYLPARTQKKVEKKVDRKKARGATDILKNLVQIHPVHFTGDSYRIIGEVYYATYRTETYTTFVNGRAVTNTRQVFDGFQYTHAAVLDLDESGQKIKDFCFSIYLFHKPFIPVKNLRITEDTDGSSRMIFSTGSSLKATVISPEREMSESDLGQIMTENEGDKVRSTGFTMCTYWYGRSYLVSGTQTIKNKEDDKVSKKRSIFFINKISY